MQLDEKDTFIVMTLPLSIESQLPFAAGDLAGKKISISGGAAPAIGGSGTGQDINSLLVDDANIDALAADWTDRQVATTLCRMLVLGLVF